ncbi:MAG: Uncharacterized protein Greene041619_1167 [Candidatus Peregrinibacteria bacterium Greene0416_19]|nr:MAG: Uncharacterized protein Greene041619_1167 [Candidatus Peregrinibacteria bacterium Greene0416_19]
MDLETQLETLNQRNRRVEQDKAWETSLTRRLTIAVITYATAAIFFWLNGLPIPLLQGFIPTGGYLLSTLSLPWMKKCWLMQKDVHEKKN